jgi:hypothetical protein
MHAVLTDVLFWIGLGIILPAGFAASRLIAQYMAGYGQQQGAKMSTD